MLSRMRFPRCTFGYLYINDKGEYVVLNDDLFLLIIAISASKRMVASNMLERPQKSLSMTMESLHAKKKKFL